MKRLLVFMILCIPVYAWGDNAVFNHGFDETPWDTGWVIDTFTSASGIAGADAVIRDEEGRSLPSCCYLGTSFGVNCGSADPSWARAEATIFQSFDEIEGCEFKAYVKYYLMCGFGGDSSKCSIQLYINDEWQPVWKKKVSFLDQVEESVWTEVCTTIVEGVVTGIKFYAWSGVGYYIGSTEGECQFWIDDIYVGKAEIEESGEFRVKSLESGLIRLSNLRL